MLRTICFLLARRSAKLLGWVFWCFFFFFFLFICGVQYVCIYMCVCVRACVCSHFIEKSKNKYSVKLIQMIFICGAFSVCLYRWKRASLDEGEKWVKIEWHQMEWNGIEHKTNTMCKRMVGWMDGWMVCASDWVGLNWCPLIFDCDSYDDDILFVPRVERRLAFVDQCFAYKKRAVRPLKHSS